MNIPRVPNWRWLTYHVLTDREHPELNKRVIDFGLWLLEEYTDTERQPFEVIGVDGLLDHEMVLDDDIDSAISLQGKPPFRRVMELMLLEHCEVALIREAIYYKFRNSITDGAVEWFRTLFWDNELLDSYDFARHYQRVGRRPKPPPVKGPFREMYVAYQQGVPVDIPLDDAMKDLFTHNFFRGKELSAMGVHAEDLAQKCHKTTLASYRALKESSRVGKAGNQEMPEEFVVEIYHPEQLALEPGDLEGYDPVEDSGFPEAQAEEEFDG